MTGHELIKALSNHDLDLDVMIRTTSGQLISIDEVYEAKDHFETRIEIS